MCLVQFATCVMVPERRYGKLIFFCDFVDHFSCLFYRARGATLKVGGGGGLNSDSKWGGG